MCAPCKLLLNHGGVIGTLNGMEKAIEHLNKRGQDLHVDTYHKLVKTICGFHADLQELETLIIDGPHVPFKAEIIPMPKNNKRKPNGPKNNKH